MTLKHRTDSDTDIYKLWKYAEADCMKASAEEACAGARVLSSLTSSIRRRKRRNAFLRVGAVSLGLSCCIALSAFFGYWFAKNEASPAPSVIESINIIADNGVQVLPDGSSVWMSEGSRLKYSSTFLDDRQVYLDGNADFNVRHLTDDAPLYVNTATGSVKVTGTSFSVIHNTPSEIQLVLYEGAIHFSSVDGKFSKTMTPGEQVRYNSETGSSHSEAFFSHIHWAAGDYILDDAPFGELREFLMWKYGVKMELRGLNDSAIKMNGVLGHNETAKDAIDKISWALKLKTTYGNGIYTLYK